MKRSDYFFFAIMLTSMLTAMYFMLWSVMPFWMQFWWVSLLPMVIVKVFFPNTKAGKWLLSDPFKQKTK